MGISERGPLSDAIRAAAEARRNSRQRKKMTRQELINALQRTGEPDAEVVLKDSDDDFLTIVNVSMAYSGEVVIESDDIIYDVVETEDDAEPLDGDVSD
jgi:hypothetical protein